jgi:hypothetical protein
MEARRRVPTILLGLLTLLAGGAVAVGLFNSPTTASVAVANATAQTYGAPLGSTSFTLDITVNVSALGTKGEISQVRRVVYTLPPHMVVYQVDPILHRLGTITHDAIASSLNQYARAPGGPTAWTHQGSVLRRTESLAAFTQRVTPGAPLPQGTVHETAEVRGGFLVLFSIHAVVPRQLVQNGGTASGGVIDESYRILSVNGKAVPNP